MTLQPKGRKNRMTANKALELFRAHGGVMRSCDALAQGIHRDTLSRLRAIGQINPMARGVYCLADLPPLSQPDLVAVSCKAPRAVICLISALAFHDLTAEVPHVVDCALPRGAEPPLIDYPPLQIYWFSPAAYAAGIAVYTVDSIPLRVYNPEKTLADCFKYRNRLGLDTVLDALRRYRTKYGLRSEALMRYARLCRVHNVMRPYLEAML